MIVAKPRASTLFSFGTFTLLGTAALAMNVSVLVSTPSPRWYTYAILVLLVPLLVFVVIRVFLRYKIVRAGNNQLELCFPVLRRKHAYKLEHVALWQENVVRTGKNRVYKELAIRFADGRTLKMGHQEITEYPRLVAYLGQKIPKKRGGLGK
ncbi:MAG: hypothetical protein MUC38_09965 [Cyclobacteriaceae bacterium]|jgi:hypothetical protein|nr:hypothetical protein [Cyclobacteriaceae bacterium]